MGSWEGLLTQICDEGDQRYRDGQPIIVFCAGDRGKHAYFTLRDAGYKVVGFADDALGKHGTTFCGLPVFASTRIPLGCHVVVAVQTVELQTKIIARLNAKGFDASSIGTFFYPNYIMPLAETYNLLEDEASRNTLYQVLLAHYDQDDKHFPPAQVGGQYWCLDFLKHFEAPRFIDAGAYTGDTLREFIDCTGGVFKEYLAFEPTLSLCSKIEDVCDEHPLLPIALFHAGLGEFDGMLRLNIKESDPNGAGNSFYDLTGLKGDPVPIHSLDSLLEGDPVDMIKADIEGFEMPMLRGAAQTIKTHKPDLMICAYHLATDLWVIPRYIKALAPEYKVFLRHHSHDYSETVVYATIH